MPLPLIIGIGAAAAGAVGIGNGVSGGMKMKKANDTVKAANQRHKRNIARFEEHSNATNRSMDELGKKEFEILAGFEQFSNILEKIQNRPQFKEYNQEGIKIPEYDKEKLKDVYVGAGAILGGIGGAAAGTFGGFAAAGATTTAVMALGTASTGTAISSLSGAAATNAALAALGGGSLAAGGGGMALGTAVLGGATLGIGLLVGGVIFNVTGSSLSDKADDAWREMEKAEKKINEICEYLENLEDVSIKYKRSILEVDEVYERHFEKLKYIVEVDNKTDWNMFTGKEKLITQNTVLLVSLLFNMCKVKIVLKSENEDELNQINYEEIEKNTRDAKAIIEKPVFQKYC